MLHTGMVESFERDASDGRTTTITLIGDKQYPYPVQFYQGYDYQLVGNKEKVDNIYHYCRVGDTMKWEKRGYSRYIVRNTNDRDDPFKFLLAFPSCRLSIDKDGKMSVFVPEISRLVSYPNICNEIVWRTQKSKVVENVGLLPNAGIIVRDGDSVDLGIYTDKDNHNFLFIDNNHSRQPVVVIRLKKELGLTH